MGQCYAVLTGDLISSRTQTAAEIDAAIKTLKSAAEILPRHRQFFSHRFTRHRGDGWQIITLPNRALEVSIALSAALTASESPLKTRIAVGIGPVTHLGHRDLSDGHGPAFEISGDLLAEMEKTADRIMIAGTGVTGWQKSIFMLTDWMLKSWSSAQAEAVYMTLKTPRSNAEHAAELGISRQAFEARLRGSGFAAAARARAAFLDWQPTEETP